MKNLFFLGVAGIDDTLIFDAMCCRCSAIMYFNLFTDFLWHAAVCPS